MARNKKPKILLNIHFKKMTNESSDKVYVKIKLI